MKQCMHIRNSKHREIKGSFVNIIAEEGIKLLELQFEGNMRTFFKYILCFCHQHSYLKNGLHRYYIPYFTFDSSFPLLEVLASLI